MFRKKATHFFKFAQKIFPRFVLVSFCPITGMITLPKRGRFPPDHPSMPRGQCPPPNTARRSAAPHSQHSPDAPPVPRSSRPAQKRPAQHPPLRSAHSTFPARPPPFDSATPRAACRYPAPGNKAPGAHPRRSRPSLRHDPFPALLAERHDHTGSAPFKTRTSPLIGTENPRRPSHPAAREPPRRPIAQPRPTT